MITLHNKTKSGLTLIEALIWFAIFAAVVAGVFALYSKTRNDSNATKVSQEIATIFSKTDSAYSSDSTDGLDNITALNLGLFPKTVKVTDASKGTVSNIFGGTITIKGTAPSEFSVTYTNIPRGDVCYKIINSQRNVGWYNFNSVGFFNASYVATNIASYCQVSGSNSTIDLTFTRSIQ
jgi:type II secretory pathway pseudopilin PulG